jgi:hypothetical protein
MPSGWLLDPVNALLFYLDQPSARFPAYHLNAFVVDDGHHPSAAIWVGLPSAQERIQEPPPNQSVTEKERAG